MSDLYIGQNYSSHVSSNSSTGSPGNSGDGINWPYDAKGQTPNIHFNPHETQTQIENDYKNLIQYLRDHPGDYNGYIRLLQMTVDMGQHLGQFPGLASFLSQELKSGDGTNVFKLMVEAAYEGAAVSQKDGASGEAAADALIHQLMNATSGLQGIPVFKTIYDTASSALDNSNPDGLHVWIYGNGTKDHPAHWEKIPNGNGGDVYSWVDDEGQPIKDFSDFANMAAFSMGMALIGDGSNANAVVNSFYETQVEQLVKEFKGNPWALLVALMNLINQRDQDRGMSINGYGANLSTLKEANGLIQTLLGDLRNMTGGGNHLSPTDAANFFATLQKLKTLVGQDPALNSLVDQLTSDIKTINGQTTDGTKGNPNVDGTYSWDVGPGFYHFPPGSTVYVDGKPEIVPANGELYFSSPSTHLNYAYGAGTNKGPLNFGELAAMGDTQDIAKSMGKWSDTVMSNFENGVTGIQTLLNGASPAIQQQIQAETQTMQAEENFEKASFKSITDMNQQIMRLIQQSMG